LEIQKIVLRIKEILLENELTIATAESLTAGLVSSYLASISGSSGYLKGGVAAYTIPIKSEVLGVDQTLAEKYNAYSPEVATQMVQGVCKLMDSDIGISTTGYAEAYPDRNIEVPQAFIARAINGEIKVINVIASDMSRNDAREYIAKKAIIFLLDGLKERF